MKYIEMVMVRVREVVVGVGMGVVRGRGSDGRKIRTMECKGVNEEGEVEGRVCE